MSKVIPQRELRNRNAEVIDAVVAGETFVVTRNGVPVAELRPVRHPPRRSVPKRDLVAMMRGAAHIDWDEWRRDMDEFVDPYIYFDRPE